MLKPEISLKYNRFIKRLCRIKGVESRCQPFPPVFLRKLSKIMIPCIMIHLMSCSSLHSQGFKGGLLAGITTSQVDGDNMSGYNKFGFQGGVFVKTYFNPGNLSAFTFQYTGKAGDTTDVVLKPRWALQLGLKYAGKGAANRFDPDNPVIRQNILHYVEFPVLMNYYYHDKWFFEGGLIPGYLNKSISKVLGNTSTNSRDYNKFDLAGALGVNYLFSPQIWLNMRFSYSLFPFYKTQAFSNCRPAYASGCFFNNVIRFGLYYQFRYKR